MTRPRTAVALGVVLLALPAVASAQGLGDAAARERAKREAKKAEAKVFTNEDLEQGRPAGTPSAGGEGSPSVAPPPSSAAPPSTEGSDTGSDDSSSEADRRAEEQRYLDGLREAQSRLAQLEGRIRELQAKLNPMSTTFIYGDFNVSGDKAAEEAQVRAELAQSEADLNSARQAVAAATQALQDFRQGRPSAPPPAVE